MKLYVKVIFSEIMRILLFPLRLLKIQRNRILFTGLTGGSTNEYSCNPAYLCEYLLEHASGKYEIVWAVSDPAKYRDLEKRGIRLVKHFSLISFPWLLTSRVIITNGSYAPWFPFRKGQYVINTWHGGGAYKKIENSMPNANWATRARARFCAENIDLFISTCRKATEKLIRGSFCYRGEVMEIGMPRNDFLVRQETGSASGKVRTYFGLDPETRILLYAPTYRYSSGEILLDADGLLQKLEHKGETWAFLYRAHRYHDDRMKIHVRGNRVKEAFGYPDMQELLAAADMMITDYSSNIWDYSFLYRPCFLYVPDLEEYLEKTGFYVDIHRWPFPMAKTQEELWSLIEAFDDGENRRKIEEHHRMMGCAESGHACELLAEKIAGVCEKARR